MNQAERKAFNKEFWVFLWSSILIALSACLGNVVDSIIVGNLIGENGVSAINLSKPVTQFMFTISMLLSTGAGMLVGMELGKKDYSRASYIFTLSTVGCLVFGLLQTIAGFFFTDDITGWLCSHEELYDATRDYLFPLMIGAPTYMMSWALGTMVGVDGSPRLVSIAILIDNAVNLGCDIIFIQWFGWGIEGSSTATVVGHIVGIVIMCWHFRSPTHHLSVSLGDGKAWPTLSQTVSQGAPLALASISLTALLFCANSIVLNTMGRIGIFAFSVCMNILYIYNLFLSGTCRTVQSLGAIQVGKGDNEQFRLVISKSFHFITIAMLITCVFIWMAPETITKFFGASEAAMIDEGVRALRIFALSFIPFCYIYTIMVVYKLYGHHRMALFISLALSLTVIPVLWIVSHAAPDYLWYSYLIAYAIEAVLIVLFHKLTHAHFELKQLNKNTSAFMIAVVSMMLLAQKGWAQSDSTKNTLNFGLNFLTHGEACGGGLPRGAEEDKSYFLMGRLRMNVDYERPGLQAHAVIQNKAVWGTSGNQALNLYEGWVKMSAKNGLFAQVGRIALSYDDERIIGPNDFAMAASSHDVLRLGYEGHGHKVHAILGFNQNASNVYNGTYYTNGAQYYKTMQTVWYHFDVPKFPLGVSLLFMNVGLQAGKNDSTAWDYDSNPARVVNQQMFGGYVNYHPEFMTLEGAYYRQTGKQVNSYKQAMDIRAWMASVKATVKLSRKFGCILGYDYLSGDDFVPVLYGGRVGMPNHEVEKGFSPMYGSRTKFYGIMEYFYESAYTNGFTPGLQNAFIGPYWKPNSKFECSASYHYLATATALNNFNRTLGHSIDVLARYRFTKDITLTAGYTQMHGTETMDRLKQGEGSKRARWGWFSLVVSPSLFTTKW
jgi:putative MATE family efflux protein